MLVDDPDLQDAMAVHWPPHAVSRQVQLAVQRLSGHIHHVLTFDCRGVSGHTNHVSTHAGVKLLKGSLTSAAEASQDYCDAAAGDPPAVAGVPPPRFWQLRTVSPLIKFTPFLYLILLAAAPLLSTLLAPYYFLKQEKQQPRRPQIAAVVVVNARAFAAMRCHASQWLWWRKLFLLFSYYTYINHLVPLE